MPLLNEAEREVIGLFIAWDAIDDMVNRVMLDLRQVDFTPECVEAFFPTTVHRDLFLIKLLDFADEKGCSELTGVSGSCLAVLEQACKVRSFDRESSAKVLMDATGVLASWLRHETSYSMWIPTLNVNLDFTVPRIEFLAIAGNQAKHNTARLTGISRKLLQMIERHGHPVAVEMIPLALDDFRAHLHEDYFTYYGSWISEMLNNIRLGIYEYCKPIYEESFEKVGAGRYTYRYPQCISQEVAKEWFWRLMNKYMHGPYVERFVSSDYLKRQDMRSPCPTNGGYSA